MQVRVTQKLTGDVDGIPLDRFVPGHVYDVGVSLGCYLLALGAVEPVSDDSPALTSPVNEAVVNPAPKLVELAPTLQAEQKNVVGHPQLAEAADRPRPRRRRRRS